MVPHAALQAVAADRETASLDTSARGRRIAALYATWLGGVVVRQLVLGLLFAACTAQLCAQQERVDQVAQRIVEGIYVLRGSDRVAEQALISQGLSAQDADRIVRDLIDGLVSCLLSELQAHAADRGQVFSENLTAMERSLDRFGAKSVLRELIWVAQGRGPQGESCALNELQKAGISLDALAAK